MNQAVHSVNYQSYLVMDSTKSFNVLKNYQKFPLREKFPKSEFFLVSIFLYLNWIWRFTPHSVQIRKYMDQKKLRIWTLHAVAFQKLWKMCFISSKKLFPFSRYSDICIFFLFLSTLSRFKRTKGSGIINDVMHWLA